MLRGRDGKHDHIFHAVLLALTMVVCFFFFWLVGRVVILGVENFSLDFLTQSPKDTGRGGGIASVLLSTLSILSICLVVAFPLGIGVAIFLYELPEHGSLTTTVLRKSVDLLASMPSIVFGLFGSVFFCEILGMGFSILAGGLTLACMVLPYFVRVIEQGLRSIPQNLRWGGVSLGFRKMTLYKEVLLPQATPSMIIGVMLGVGRALSETAALIFTSGYVDRTPESIFDSGRSLSVHIYDLSMNVSGGDTNAYRSAFVLLILVLLINLFAMSFIREERFCGVVYGNR